MDKWRSIWFLAVIPLAIVLGSCVTADKTVAPEEPATLDEVVGTDFMRITLTESAAVRLDIQTVPVTTMGDRLVVPSAAVFITDDGSYWVYTNPEPLVYVRAEIEPVVEENLEAFFTEGPAPGTPVVTVGVPELYGTEFGVGK